jgi:hypothetical protein
VNYPAIKRYEADTGDREHPEEARLGYKFLRNPQSHQPQTWSPHIRSPSDGLEDQDGEDARSEHEVRPTGEAEAVGVEEAGKHEVLAGSITQ